MTGIEALKAQSLFSWISQGPLESLLSHAHTESLKDGEVLYQAETPGDAIYLIMEGKIEFKPPTGSPVTLTAGEMFGECSLIEIRHRTCQTTAKGATEVLILDHSTIYKFSQDFPDPYSIIVTNLARCLAARIRDLNNQKASTSTKSTAQDGEINEL
jgi:CRP-like cAMP-binding protein